jgi:hypothetical protein
MKGWSVICHAFYGHYIGRYVAGIFSDNNRWLNAGVDLKPGWGVKFDLHWFEWLEPIPRFWLPAYWRADTHRQWNEWTSGRHWFVWSCPIWFPKVFLSISTPFRSVYLGWKTYDMEPGTGDKSWAADRGPIRCGWPGSGCGAPGSTRWR